MSAIFDKQQLQYKRLKPYAVSVCFTTEEFTAFRKFIKSRRKANPNRILPIKEILKSIVMSAMISDGFWQEAK